MTERETESVTVETVTDHADPGGITGETTKPTFTEAQQTEVNRLIAREKRDAATKARADAKAERDAADAQTRTEAERKKAEERGEFEKVRGDLERERDEARTERDALKADAQRHREAIAAALDADWKKLPDAVRDAYSGPDDDPLARLAWLPKGKALADGLAQRDDRVRGNGRDPLPGGRGRLPEDETARALNARRYG